MKHLAPLALLVLLSACGSSTQAIHSFRSDLAIVMHDNDTGYMLLVYEDLWGEARHVVRREGICELVIIYAADGTVRVQERGSKERTLTPSEAMQLTEKVNALFKGVRPASGIAEVI